MVKFKINNTVINTENIEKLKDKMPELKKVASNVQEAGESVDEEFRLLNEERVQKIKASSFQGAMNETKVSVSGSEMLNTLTPVSQSERIQQAEKLADWQFRNDLDEGEVATISQELNEKLKFSIMTLGRRGIAIDINDEASETYKNTYNKHLNNLALAVSTEAEKAGRINKEQKEIIEKAIAEKNVFPAMIELQKAELADVFYKDSYKEPMKDLDRLKMLNRAAVAVNLTEPDGKPLSEMYGIKTLDESSLREIIARVSVMSWSNTESDRAWRLKEIEKMSENLHARMEGRTIEKKSAEKSLDINKMDERLEDVQKKLDAIKNDKSKASDSAKDSSQPLNKETKNLNGIEKSSKKVNKTVKKSRPSKHNKGRGL